jgi:uncharacterized membrane protein
VVGVRAVVVVSDAAVVAAVVVTALVGAVVVVDVAAHPGSNITPERIMSAAMIMVIFFMPFSSVY